MSDPVKIQRKPDAVRCPRDYPKRPGQDKDVLRNLIFGKWFGSRRVTSTEHMETDESFVVPYPTVPLIKHPHGHPNQLEDRYEWFVLSPESGPNGEPLPGLPEVGDPAEAGRIKLGYLKEDPHADDPNVKASIASEYDRRLAEAWQDPEHQGRLAALSIVAAPVASTPKVKPAVMADGPPKDKPEA